MPRDFKERLMSLFPQLGPHWDTVSSLFRRRVYPEKSVILHQGETATRIHFVVRGCIRAFVIREDGKEITLQFFFEGQMVASLESFFTGTPSRVCLEALEETEAAVSTAEEFGALLGIIDPARVGYQAFLVNRLIYYVNMHNSYILDSPEERYIKLVEEHPQLVRRIPQYYLATYLGVTPVSLSRIRARLKKRGLINEG